MYLSLDAAWDSLGITWTRRDWGKACIATRGTTSRMCCLNTCPCNLQRPFWPTVCLYRKNQESMEGKANVTILLCKYWKRGIRSIDVYFGYVSVTVKMHFFSPHLSNTSVDQIHLLYRILWGIKKKHSKSLNKFRNWSLKCHENVMKNIASKSKILHFFENNEFFNPSGWSKLQKNIVSFKYMFCQFSQYIFSSFIGFLSKLFVVSNRYFNHQIYLLLNLEELLQFLKMISHIDLLHCAFNNIVFEHINSL